MLLIRPCPNLVASTAIISQVGLLTRVKKAVCRVTVARALGLRERACESYMQELARKGILLTESGGGTSLLGDLDTITVADIAKCIYRTEQKRFDLSQIIFNLQLEVLQQITLADISDEQVVVDLNTIQVSGMPDFIRLPEPLRLASGHLDLIRALLYLSNIHTPMKLGDLASDADIKGASRNLGNFIQQCQYMQGLRGPRGGHTLCWQLHAISLLSIVRLKGNTRVRKADIQGLSWMDTNIILSYYIPFWQKISQRIRAKLATTSLEDLQKQLSR